MREKRTGDDSKFGVEENASLAAISIKEHIQQCINSGVPIICKIPKNGFYYAEMVFEEAKNDAIRAYCSAAREMGYLLTFSGRQEDGIYTIEMTVEDMEKPIEKSQRNFTDNSNIMQARHDKVVPFSVLSAKIEKRERNKGKSFIN